VDVLGVNMSSFERFLLVYESYVPTIRLPFVVALFTHPVYIVV